MNLNKSKDRTSILDERKNDRYNSNKFVYPIKEDYQNKSYPQKDKAHSRKDKNPLKQLNETDLQSKENEALFKNMQKCNQKMEFYKLMGSLQEQKRNMLEQENYFLKTQNQELKQQVTAFKKQIKKLSKRLEKLNAEIEQYRIKQNDMVIQIPKKLKNRTSHGQYQVYNQQESQACTQCAQLSQKFEEERSIYERDRNYLKQQIENLAQTLENTKKQQKIMNKELEGRGSFSQNKEVEIIQTFKNKQNQLKKQLTFCYKAFQQKCKLVSELEAKIYFFQQQNQRILKLLTLLDQKKIASKNPYQKYQLFQKKQERAKSSYNTKNKNFQYSDIYDQKRGIFEVDAQNIIQNRRKNRKCGSIKKIDVD